MIRRYQLSDIDEFVPPLQEHLKQSSFKNFHFHEQKFRDILVGNVRNVLFFCNVYEKDKDIAGVFCGGLTAPIFSKEVYAHDYLLYIKEKYRSAAAATALVESYTAWAKERGAKKVMLSNSTGNNIESFAKLAEKLGFKTVGSIHFKEI